MDKQITLWIFDNLHGSEFINTLFKFITYLGSAGIFWIVVDLTIALVVLIKYKKLSLAMILALGALLTGWIFNDFILKPIFNRNRPYQDIEAVKNFMDFIGYAYPSGASFPSGHTFSSIEQAFILTFYNKKLGYFAIPIAALISFSRIFLGAHYFTDVIAGAVIGIIFALLFKLIYAKIKKTKKLQNSKLFI